MRMPRGYSFDRSSSGSLEMLAASRSTLSCLKDEQGEVRVIETSQTRPNGLVWVPEEGGDARAGRSRSGRYQTPPVALLICSVCKRASTPEGVNGRDGDGRPARQVLTP
jgi:hypothetical protein